MWQSRGLELSISTGQEIAFLAHNSSRFSEVAGIAPTSSAVLLEVLDLPLQLDHLELTSDGQFLELLEFLQPFLLPGLLLGDLPLCLLLRGHVAGDSEHAKHLAVGVSVDRGVVQDF